MKSILTVLGVFIIYGLFSLLGAWIAITIYTALNIQGLPELSYWQMYGIMWLVRLIIPVNTSIRNK